MKRVNIHDAKTHLSRYIAELEPGESIQICRRNEPVAELRAIGPRRTGPRPVGLAKGTFVVPESFWEPLSADLLDAFEGND